MVNVNRLMDKVTEKKGMCKEHGSFYVIVHKDLEPDCPQCGSEKQEQINRQIWLQTKLRNAGVGIRHIDCTFDNYEVTNQGQQEALEKVRWLIDNFKYAVGLVFVGEKGTGKNHLATAVTRELIIKQNKTVKIVKMLDMMFEIKDTYNTDVSQLKVLKRFLDPDLLIIDEVGLQFKTDTERLYFQKIIDDRYEATKPTILISNLSLKLLPEYIGDRTLDRFMEKGRSIAFDWESWRSKVSSKWD